MPKDPTPEEKLLALIKNKPKKESVPGDRPSREAQAEGVPVSVTMSARIGQNVRQALKSELFNSKLFEPATLKRVNRYLAIALAVLLLYLVTDLIFVNPSRSVELLISKISDEDTAEEPATTQATSSLPPKDYNTYSSVISGKTLFGQSQGGESKNQTVMAESSSDLGLVGVITGDTSLAIIEDKKSKKTYQLTKGQSFEGYTLEEVYPDKIILDSDGKKTSLYL